MSTTSWNGSASSELGVAAVTPGGFLAARRGERGLTLQQASSATRIRLEHLSALEADEPELLPAPVYARGYLRTYARYLGLDADSLVARMPQAMQDTRRSLSLTIPAPRPRLVLSGPAAALVGLLLLAGAFAAYAWRQIEADQSPTIITAPADSPGGSPLPSPSPSSHTSP
ncbi:MAG: helix-turn-helix domain-containing protein [Chloroflexi bacterium]|nr:MAG: helix-turn-helix domain-containing protein [Chloroflexota bacterium]TME58770.1 MAG: helix-turn-helix domain-containing protein [Chloroflexota bacterium]